MSARRTRFSSGLLILFMIGSAILASETRAPAPTEEKARPKNTLYAVVAEKKTAEQPPWKAVVEALREKHSARVFYWDSAGVNGLRKELAAFGPRYVCFVARPDELARQGKLGVPIGAGRSLGLTFCGSYYHRAGTLMCSLDGDPYDDAVWAVLTGATPEDALRVVSAKPLVVRRGLSHVGAGWLEWLESGVSFSEVNKGQKWVKQPGKPPEETQGPDDTTEQFLEELNSGQVDMVSSSGHATEHDWQMGYSYPSGRIVTPSRIARLPKAARDNYEKLLEAKAAAGHIAKLFGVDRSNRVYPILTDNPKIYYSPGNCLIGRVDGQRCMVLGWIHHGAMQFFGHVGVQTSSCYAWGVAEYFLALGGRFSFAESVWLNRQALRWQLSQMSEEDRKWKYLCCRNETWFPIGPRLVRETTVLYGNPAWDARVKPVAEPLYDQQMHTRKLDDGRLELTFTVTMRRARVPSRPAAFFLEAADRSHVEVKEGPENLVVADNFALVPFWKPGQPAPEIGRQYKAVVVVATVHGVKENPR